MVTLLVPCTEMKNILSEEISDNSESEIRQRQKINEHLKVCDNYNCYLTKVDRINKGLY